MTFFVVAKQAHDGGRGRRQGNSGWRGGSVLEVGFFHERVVGFSIFENVKFSNSQIF
jgi:hypothetical protein